MSKVALVSAHFMPEVGYQEVYLAKAFARLGHEVEVFTSTAISPSSKKVVKQPYEPGRSKCDRLGYYVNRIKPTLALASNVWASGVKSRVMKFDPEFVVMVGVAKMFGLEVCRLSQESSRAKVAAVFGDAAEYIQRGTFKQKCRAFIHDAVFRFIKNRVYRNAVQCVDRIVLNTPETEEYLRTLLPGRQHEEFDRKKMNLRLGFDPEEFRFDVKSRERIRKELGIKPDTLVAITSTRVLPSKNLEKIVASVTKMHGMGIDLDYIIIGFLDNDYGRALKELIAKQPHSSRFHCFGFKNHQEISQLYSVADIGIWLKAAISIQEAMGTGLPILLEQKPIVSHLIKDGITGWFYENPDSFFEGFKKAVSELELVQNKDRLTSRVERREANASFLSYDVIAKEILEGLG